MPDMTQQLITWTRVNNDKSLSVYYPKTVASQVFLDAAGHTLADHVQNMNAHLTAVERGRLNATGNANGYALLDAQGFVPAANINPSILAVTTEVANIAALTNATFAEGIEQGQLVWVNDASGDNTVDSGWAIYRKRVGVGIDYTILNPVVSYVAASGVAEADVTYYTDNTGATAVDPATITVGTTDVSSYFVATETAGGWTKVSEGESLDVVLDWANIQGKPLSPVESIDSAVAQMHTHNNFDTVLQQLVDTSVEDSENPGTYTSIGLTYKGKAIAFNDEVSHIALADSDSQASAMAASMNENDIILVVSNNNYTLPSAAATEYTV